MTESRRRTGLVAAVAIAATGAALSIGNQAVSGDSLDLLFGVVANLTFTSVGTIILWRRPSEMIGRILLAIGLVIAISTIVGIAASAIDPSGTRFTPYPAIALALSEVLGGVALVFGGVSVVVRFPSGRRTSRLGTVAEGGLVVGMVGSFLTGVVEGDAGAAFDSLSLLVIFGALLVAAVDIVRRYRRSGGLERTQIKWVGAGSAVTGALIVLVLVAGEAVPWAWELMLASFMLPPVAIGIAITRYRLYEIDRIVSRTIGYGLVTGALFVVFWAVNIGLQGLLSEATRSEPLIVAGSTLLVAALFNPLRIRVQRVVDRRFNRARYDAEQTVERFSGRLRDELDLATLAGELQRTTSAAVEPTTSSVWLRAGGAR